MGGGGGPLSRNGWERRDSVELVPPRLETPRPSDVIGLATGPRRPAGSPLPRRRAPTVAALRARAHPRASRGRLAPMAPRHPHRLAPVREERSSRAASAAGGSAPADLFGEPQEVLHVANLRDTAKRIWTPAARTAGASHPAPHVRRSNGQEAIELARRLARGGSPRRRSTAASARSVSLAFVDEAWRVSRERRRRLDRADDAGASLAAARPRLDGRRWRLDAPPRGSRRRDRAARRPRHGADPPARMVGAAGGLPRRPGGVAARLAALDAGAAGGARTRSRDELRDRLAAPVPESVGSRGALLDRAGAVGGGGRRRARPPACAGRHARRQRRGRPAGRVRLRRSRSPTPTATFASAAAPSRRGALCGRSSRSSPPSGAASTLLYPPSFERHVARLRGVEARRRSAPPSSAPATARRSARSSTAASATTATTSSRRQMLDGDAGHRPRRRARRCRRAAPRARSILARAAVWAVGAELRPERRPRAMVIAG